MNYMKRHFVLFVFISLLFILTADVSAQVFGNSISQGSVQAPRVSVGTGANSLFRTYSYGLPETFQNRSMPNPLRYTENRNFNTILGSSAARGYTPPLAANPPLRSRTSTRISANLLASTQNPYSNGISSFKNYVSSTPRYPESRVIQTRNRLPINYNPNLNNIMPARDNVSHAILQDETKYLPSLQPRNFLNSYRQVSTESTNSLLVSKPNSMPIYQGMTGNELRSPYQLYSNNISRRISLIK